MGWVCAGKVKGFKKAYKNCPKIIAVCAVGLAHPDPKAINDIAARNKIDKTKFFYLQGGLDKSKMNWFNKLIITIAIYFMRKKNPDAEMLDVYKHGGSFVKEENLAKVADYCRTAK
jgi:hypothetical protein